jgi:hypothetical protein
MHSTLLIINYIWNITYFLILSNCLKSSVWA